MNHIAQLGRMASDLAQKRFHILVVGGSDSAAAQDAIAAFKETVDIVIDRDRSVYRRFGYRKLVGVVQKSGTMVIEMSGTVRYVHRTNNPKYSLKKEELLQVVQCLA